MGAGWDASFAPICYADEALIIMGDHSEIREGFRRHLLH